MNNLLLYFFLVLQTRQLYFRNFTYLKKLFHYISQPSADQALQLPWGKTTFPRSDFVYGERPSRHRGPWETRGRHRELSGKRAHERGCLTRVPRNGSEARRGAGGRAPTSGMSAGRGGQAHSVPLDPLLQLSKGKGQEPGAALWFSTGTAPSAWSGP